MPMVPVPFEAAPALGEAAPVPADAAPAAGVADGTRTAGVTAGTACRAGFAGETEGAAGDVWVVAANTALLSSEVASVAKPTAGGTISGCSGGRSITATR